MDDYLTADELVLLTGYKRRADHVRWLTERGWVFEIARGGRPVVLRTYRDAKMSGKQPEMHPIARHNFEALRVVKPDIEALKARLNRGKPTSRN